MASLLVQLFWTAQAGRSLHLQWAHWAAPFPLKIAPSDGDLERHLIHGCLSPQPKRHLDQFSRLCRAHYYDRPTDHVTGTRSVTIGRINVCSTAMPPYVKSI